MEEKDLHVSKFMKSMMDNLNEPISLTSLTTNKFPIFFTIIIQTYLMFVGAYICAKCISAKELES